MDSGKINISSNGVTFEYDCNANSQETKPATDGHIEEIGTFGSISKRVPIEMIEDAKKMAIQKNEIFCIYKIEEKKPFLSYMSKKEKRDMDIESILNDDFFIDHSDILKDFHSINTYYDTETDSTDQLTRHQRVIDFLDSIGLKRMYNLEPLEDKYYNIEDVLRFETSYMSVLLPRIIIRVKPNLMVNLIILPETRSEGAPGVWTQKEFRFFFNRNRIINEMS
jgi:hypothetical protein